MDDKFGGKYARKGEGSLWKFTDEENGSFIAPEAEYVSRLFFPVFNRYGMKSSVTPDLKGDLCTDFNHYHSIPVVTEDLHRVLNNRNVWVKIDGNEPWSATGNSSKQKASRWTGDDNEQSQVKGEPGIFRLERENRELGVKTGIDVFVPEEKEYVEIIRIGVENISDREKTLRLFFASPIYGRSADNLRDHRNVTTMFIENYLHEHGVRIKPRINFNEFGHTDNETSYVVLGFDGEGNKPETIWSTVRDFIGEGGSLDTPEAVYRDLPGSSANDTDRNGFEAIGAFRFKEITLKPGETKSYVVVQGITDDAEELNKWKKMFGHEKLAEDALQNTRKYWSDLVNKVSFKSGDSIFNNWMKWVNYQLFCRQVYGNSYLPDFGYGRGGRGWRDLFSDLISIFLIDPENARDEIINNFKGIRVDGTNATIIGTRSGEFKADRNNVPRVWSDHGTWPFFVLNFYMQQSGDIDVIFKNTTYWKDRFSFRSKKIDPEWDESRNKQETPSGEIYEGTILEHTLLQHLCSFFNVGENNNILLEGADWNDTYDMARQKGESVSFHNWYGGNLKEICNLLTWHKNNRNLRKVEILEEASMLLDSLSDKPVDYQNPAEKKKFLHEYYEKVSKTVSGKKVSIPVDKLISDLEKKADHIVEHIRKNEWLETESGNSFYNGHYDNSANRVHGDHPRGVRMDLTSQVLPIIFGTATDEQIPLIYKSIRDYLHDKNTGGLRLCTEFKEDKLYFGRLTGFIYGHKEHGGKWMQQNVMLLYGLYKRGFVKEGFEVLQDVYKLCNDSATARTFPGIPSYFETDGHGAYHYLTGSATWLTLALVTQVYGIRGSYGDLLISPKLVKEQFEQDNKTAIMISFKNKPLEIIFRNANKKEYGTYKIVSAELNEEKLNISKDNEVVISTEVLEKLSEERTNVIQIEFD